MLIIVVGSDQQESSTHLKGSDESDSSKPEHIGANQQGESGDDSSSVQQDSSDEDRGDAPAQQASRVSKKTKASTESKEEEATTFLFISNLSRNIDEEWITRGI